MGRRTGSGLAALALELRDQAAFLPDLAFVAEIAAFDRRDRFLVGRRLDKLGGDGSAREIEAVDPVGFRREGHPHNSTQQRERDERLSVAAALKARVRRSLFLTRLNAGIVNKD